ncbi:MAG: GNAT family N-acetyltransferase [Roseobacter sp.]
MTPINVKPIVPADLPQLAEVVDAAGLFPGELLAGMVADKEAALWLAASVEGRAVGLCFTEPEDFAPGVWNMRALGVDPALHRQGVGAALVTTTEGMLRKKATRLVIVETSDAAEFEGARRFYQSQHYQCAARIPNFWAPGEAKVICTKSFI